MQYMLAVLLLLAAFGSTWCQESKIPIGAIEFFGVNGYDVKRIRAALPVAEGREISQADSPMVRDGIAEAVKRTTGHAPTDVAFVCCDNRGGALIYIGLPQPGGETFRYKPRPNGNVRLPDQAARLYDETMDLNSTGVRIQPGEDDSKGYALSLYPPLRAKELAMREFAVDRGVMLRRVVLQAADDRQRAIAAHLLGYARQSSAQIQTLVSASSDPDESVRNNATRALGVLASSSAAIARSIPADPFITMLNSGTWTDRNKGGWVMSQLSATRDPRLLRKIRGQALSSLIEMAQWRDSHAQSARWILGRIAGIPEAELAKLVAAPDAEQIITAVERAR